MSDSVPRALPFEPTTRAQWAVIQRLPSDQETTRVQVPSDGVPQPIEIETSMTARVETPIVMAVSDGPGTMRAPTVFVSDMMAALADLQRCIDAAGLSWMVSSPFSVQHDIGDPRGESVKFYIRNWSRFKRWYLEMADTNFAAMRAHLRHIKAERIAECWFFLHMIAQKLPTWPVVPDTNTSFLEF